MFGIKHGDSDLSIKTLFTGHIYNKSTDDIGFFFRVENIQTKHWYVHYKKKGKKC